MLTMLTYNTKLLILPSLIVALERNNSKTKNNPATANSKINASQTFEHFLHFDDPNTKLIHHMPYSLNLSLCLFCYIDIVCLDEVIV